MREEVESILDRMYGTASGSALKEYLDEELERMKDVTSIKGTIEEMGKTVLARQEAEKIIKRVFRFLTPKSEVIKRESYR